MIFGDDGLPYIQAVVVKLDHLMAVHAEKVSVAGGIGKIRIILRRLLTQTDLTDESAADEKGKRTVNCRAGNFGIPLAGASQEGFGGKMILAPKCHFRDGPPLRSHP